MNFLAIDFETANSSRDSVCEIGLAFVEDYKIIDSKSYLVKPSENSFAPLNIGIHGIRANDVKDEPEFNVIWESIKHHFDKSYVIAHNSAFDMSVLRKVLDLYDIEYPNFKYSCTYQISKKAWAEMPNHKLNSLCERLNIPLNHHRAEDDAIACAKVALKLIKDFEVRSFEEISSKFHLQLGEIFSGGYSPSRSKSKSRKR